MEDLKPKPWIVCAAIRDEELDLNICAPRHHDMTMWYQVAAMGDDIKENARFMKQGFVDQYGKFYNRVDAMQIVKESGQPFNAERNSGSGEELYSEGLY